MNRIRLYDGSFAHECSATLSGDNSGKCPTYFSWCRDGCDSLFTWYTDMYLAKGVSDFFPERIAWLIEPPSMSDTHYQIAYKLRRHFRRIFTFVRFYIEMGPPFSFYPLGGSWIEDHNWGMWGKGKDVSIIASEKNASEGHQLRHKIIEHYRGTIHAYGGGYKKVGSKVEALADYRYSVVVENWKGDWYFSEKLIDCLSIGTIPIYWGCPSIGDFFDIGGILQFDNFGDLEKILDFIGPDDYRRRYDAAMRNLEKAKEYRVAEDWLFEKHNELFK